MALPDLLDLQQTNRGGFRNTAPIRVKSRGSVIQLSFALANESCVFVVEFVRDTLRPGLRGDELDLTDQISAPGLIDARAELPSHAPELLAPALSVGGNFEIAPLATNRPRVSGKSFSYDCRPRPRKPGESGFRSLDSAHDFSQNLRGSAH